MADNTKQFDWIVLLKDNLDRIRDDFVAGDLLWYAVQGQPKVRVAPDVLVAVGRPKGDRGSFKQWLEGGPPEVVFEVLSPGNSLREMIRKSAFYGRHGVREFIIVDPDEELGWALMYDNGEVREEVPDLDGWTSPILGIRFERRDDKLIVIGPDGRVFVTLKEAAERAEYEAQRADHEAERAEREAERAEREAERAEKLAAKLRALGIDPDA